MITTFSNQTYRITYQGISLVENALDNPNLIQISVTSECTIMVAPNKDYGIDYLPNGEYRSWKMTGVNTRLNRIEAHNIYARLSRSSNEAMILFSINDYALDGSKGPDGEASTQYYYVKIGSITATDSLTDATLDREITIDFGYLTTPAGQEGSITDTLFDITADDLIRPLKKFASFIVQGTLSIIGRLVLNNKQISDIARQADEGEFTASDESIPTTALLTGKYLDRLRNIFLNKDKEDSTGFVQTFLKGIKFGKYNTGTLGTGGAVLVDENGESHAEFDYLNIRKKALFTDITVQELKNIGGALIISPASMIISKVEETDAGYKCYFNRKDSDGKTIYNEFEKDDQGRCQTFNLETQENGQVGNRYWWRLVTETGDDYVIFSKTDADTGSDIPQAGDQVSQLGNRSDRTRQNAQIYSAYGSDSPSRKMYQGINSYDLTDKVIKDEYFDVTTGRFKEVTYGDQYTGNREGTSYLKNDQDEGVSVAGKMEIQSGSKGAANLEDLPDEIYNAVKIGGENLLLNTGFVGNYETLNLDSSTGLNSNTEMYNTSLDKWTGTAILQKDTDSLSGVSATLSSQQPLSQIVALIQGENYVISYKAKGTNIKIKCGGNTITQELTAEYKRYSHVFTSNTGNTFEMSGDCTVCEIKLERGTIPTDWCPSVLDPNAIKDKFKDLWYLQDALKGETQFIGGLTLTSMILLGKWTDGVLEKVNAGISGIYNDDTDVAFWSGGTFQQAIATVQKLLDGEIPTDEEWKSLAKFVATHGGDIFLRGYIYALGGVFRGTIYAKDGEFNGKISIGNGNILLNQDGSGQLAGGNIKWTKENFLQINSLISSPFVGLTGIYYPDSKRWVFSIGKFMDSFKNNFWLNMDDIYDTEDKAYIEFPYQKEWEGSTVMFFNRGLSESIKTIGTDYDEKELLPGMLYMFVLINTNDLTKWHCSQL